MFSKRFLFRFQFPCKHIDAASVTALDKTYQLPDLLELENSVEHCALFCRCRSAWNESGLLFSASISGKQQRPWCRAEMPESSDGLQLFIDTRNIKDIHRASRFCHRLLVMPSGSGQGNTEPTVIWLPIPRAKEHPKPIDLKLLQVRSAFADDGYRLDLFLPGKILTGYEPREHSEIGFHYSLIDKEYSNLSFSAAPPLPADQDPSLWTALQLI
ncbi:hypothetical protein FACS1894170_08610 [Planctomycetales bacterium]|nr:hypothetical protein FACS1894170_08610 [Planctomycetales bacterium]